MTANIPRIGFKEEMRIKKVIFFLDFFYIGLALKATEILWSYLVLNKILVATHLARDKGKSFQNDTDLVSVSVTFILVYLHVLLHFLYSNLLLSNIFL